MTTQVERRRAQSRWADPKRRGTQRKRASRLWFPIVERLENMLLLSTVVESEPNDVLALANAYQLTQDPSGSGFYTSLGVGAITPGGDVDYWSFPALKGDHVTISGDGGISGSAIYLELHDANE